MSQDLVLKSVLLGILLFLFDLLVFLSTQTDTKKKMSKSSVQKAKSRIGFIIPIELFIQVFFALILMFTFHFLLAFNIISKDLIGSFSYAFIFFVPMLYLLLNSWLWGDKEFNEKLLLSMISWLLKFAITGIYLGLI